MEELAGLRALVTGGASGLGQVMARHLVMRGATVACLDLDISGLPDSCLGFQGDVSSDTVATVVAEVAEGLGGLDIVVNNAGILSRGTIEDNDIAEWQRVFDVNVFGIVRVTRAALPWLRESRSAAVVNICSLGAVRGLPASAAYCASKGAVYALTLSMAADHVADGIRVNCVVPGPLDTPKARRVLDSLPNRDAALAALAARQPMGHLISPDEVAAAVCYLASPLASASTGTSINIDGGALGIDVAAQAAVRLLEGFRRESA